MEVPGQLTCLFTANIEEDDDTYIIEVPKQELKLDNITAEKTYRVAVLPVVIESDPSSSASEEQTQTESGPPVDVGETRTVEIDAIGDAGDGIARVDHGFVIIVPDTDIGERVRIEITNVRENVAFADVIERIDYYE